MFKRVFLQVIRETKGYPIYLKIQSFRILLALTQANHDKARLIATKIPQQHYDYFGDYYLAMSSFYCGEFTTAHERISQFLTANPNHADGVYLKASVLDRLGKKDQALVELAAFALNSKRPKLWLIMANICCSEQDFTKLMKAHEACQDAGVIAPDNAVINSYLAHAALRCKQYDGARELWRQSIKRGVNNVKSTQKPRRQSFSTGAAAIALRDLQQVFEKAQVDMFLISGTLLGCVREQNILGHDKDIDVGIWHDVARDLVIEIIDKSPDLFLLPAQSETMFYVRHMNGIAIDVFYHYRERENYWHAGVKTKWNNSPFTLAKQRFLNYDYLVPADFDTYLTENYGDWRTPQKVFDSTYDTPNAEIINHEAMVLYTLEKLFLNLNSPQQNYYIDKLLQFGEEDFLKSCHIYGLAKH